MRCHNKEVFLKTKVISFGVFVALALIFSYVEALIPVFIGVPGMKLGLANLIVVIALYKATKKETILLSIVRVLLAGFMFGNMFSILYSMAGAMLSLITMILLKQCDKFSVVGISIAGGTAHNMGQMIVAMLVIESYSIVYYAPFLLISGVVTGFLIGIVAKEMLARLTKINL